MPLYCGGRCEGFVPDSQGLGNPGACAMLGPASPSWGTGAGLDLKGIQPRSSEPGVVFTTPSGELKNEVSLNFLPGLCDCQALMSIYWAPIVCLSLFWGLERSNKDCDVLPFKE